MFDRLLDSLGPKTKKLLQTQYNLPPYSDLDENVAQQYTWAFRAYNSQVLRLRKEKENEERQRKANEAAERKRQKQERERQQQRNQQYRTQYQRLSALFQQYLSTQLPRGDEMLINISEFNDDNGVLGLMTNLYALITMYAPETNFIISTHDGARSWTLNFNNRERILREVQQAVAGVVDENIESGKWITHFYNVTPVFRLSALRNLNGNNRRQGAFFKYWNNTDIDLSRYQIYPRHAVITDEKPENKKQRRKTFLQSNKHNAFENCLIHSLTIAGVESDKLNHLKTIVKGFYTPLTSMGAICRAVQLHISVKTEAKNQIIHFGDRTQPEIKLGLIKSHYFLVEQIPITLFALKNHHELKHIEGYNEIYEQNGKYYKRDKTRFIDSFKAIKTMVTELESTHLLPIQKHDLLNTTLHECVDESFESLDYTPYVGETHKEVTNGFGKKSVFAQSMTDEIKLSMYDPSEYYIGIDELPKLNVYYDLETYTRYSKVDSSNVEEKRHFPYVARLVTECGFKKFFHGPDCVRNMLDWMKNHLSQFHCVMIAHNGGRYDIKFFYDQLWGISEIANGSSSITASACYYDLKLTFRDSYLMIASPLHDFKKMFALPIGKIGEEFSYDMYNETDCVARQWIPIEEGIEWIKKAGKNVDRFVQNIYDWGIERNGLYDCIMYSSKYCELDCDVLRLGWQTFRKWCIEFFSIDIDAENVLTICSLAHRYLIARGCYKGVYALSGVAQRFIQQSVVGGRTMCSENQKDRVLTQNSKELFRSFVDNVKSGKEKDNESTPFLLDFDAVSLYPSAMYSSKGFLRGIPRVLKNMDYGVYGFYDGFYVKIRIDSVGIRRKFPLMSYIDEEAGGVRCWTNDMVGREMVVDKITLQDLIEFHQITFTTLQGYYFNEGFNSRICGVIQEIFERRRELKSKKNPAEKLMKLVLNSAYGKTIQREHGDEFHYFNTADQLESYLNRNFEHVVEIECLAKDRCWRVKSLAPVHTHFNICTAGSRVLSQSKHLMNRVMCLAEDIGIKIFYQDTDSMHIAHHGIQKLQDAFRTKYGSELIGDDLCQFHSDFDLDGAVDNVYAVNSVFLGKKCYVDHLMGTDKNGEIVDGYHIRMKGCSHESVMHAMREKGFQTPLELYNYLYSGNPITFDLTCGGEKSNFRTVGHGTIITVKEFSRELKF
eukprot:gene26410-31912_t